MMTSVKASLLARQHLDDRLFRQPIDSLSKRLARPQKGWIKAIREALGMSTAQLAKRVGVSQPSIFEIESNEASGTVKIETLERVAAALNCRLVYALIPNKPLEEMVSQKALDVARQYLANVEHSMRLENQAVDDDAASHRHLNLLLSKLDMRRIWDE